MLSKGASRLWVLAMNSTRARVLRGLNLNSDSPPVELIMKADARRLRDVISARPGMDFSARNRNPYLALEYGGETIDEDRSEFIRQIFALLESHRRAGEFDKLAIFAEANVLGSLSQLMPKTLCSLVVCVVPKNLIHLSAQDLPNAIVDELSHGAQFS